MSEHESFNCFQLPLSGSHNTEETWFTLANGLSTPSLGITSGGSLLMLAKSTSSFQLPLSGSQRHLQRRLVSVQEAIPFNSLSRDHLLVRARMIRLAMLSSTFNSLSRDHRLTAPAAAAAGAPAPFNSLSRDHMTASTSFVNGDAGVDTFNSLSRDHRALFRDFPALRGFPPRRPFAHLYFPATI